MLSRILFVQKYFLVYAIIKLIITGRIIMNRFFLWCALTVILHSHLIPLYSDAGYLASISSGPSPVTSYDKHPCIEMTAEEVVIIIFKQFDLNFDEPTETYSAEIYTSFLFTNTGEQERILMAIPVEVITPFVSYLYGYEENDSLLSNPRVYVNGQEVEVSLIFGSIIQDNLTVEELEFIEKYLDPLFDQMPLPGQPLYFRNFQIIQRGVEDISMELLSPNIALACWEVEFEEKEQKLVEYRQNYEMTADYGMKAFRLSYPLFTGATWSGSIGRGKISVILDDDISPQELVYFLGVGLPEPREIERGTLDLTDYLSLLENPEISTISRLNGRYFNYGVEWEFKDLQPLPSDFSYRNYYPDIGDIGAVYYMEYLENPDQELKDLRLPWQKSKLYFGLGDFPLKTFWVVNPCGVNVYSEPDDQSGNIISSGSPLSHVVAEEIQGRWIKADISDYVNDVELKGWVPIYYYNQDGLLELNLMLLLDSYYE
ncbi:MAG: hypothetical protein APR63_13215 [Desulfuromonas sp. SDB]|nr:MAG: hypothetical protein APR63_13215 [Desulfuromonas sp. SDB]